MDIKNEIKTNGEFNIKFADVLNTANKNLHGEIKAFIKDDKYMLCIINAEPKRISTDCYRYTIDNDYIRIESIYGGTQEDIDITIPKNPDIKMLIVPAGWTISMREELIKVLNSLS